MCFRKIEKSKVFFFIIKPLLKMQSNPPEQTLDQDPIDIPMIISALKRRANYERVFQDAEDIHTLCTGIGTNGIMWRACVEAGGLPVFVTMLKRHKTTAHICKNAALGLAYMLGSPHPDLLSPNYHDIDALIAADGINALLDVLDHHFAHTDICVNTCEALALIASLAAQQCVDSDIIPLLLDLAESKSYEATLMRHISNLLYQISKNCALTDTDYKAILRLTITVLEDFPYNTEICSAAGSALASIVTTNPAYPAFALEHNARDALLTVQNSHAHGQVASLHRALHSIAEKTFEQHPHVLSAHTNNHHSCDICEASADNFMGCRTCDYDECMMCFNSKQK